MQGHQLREDGNRIEPNHRISDKDHLGRSRTLEIKLMIRYYLFYGFFTDHMNYWHAKRNAMNGRESHGKPKIVISSALVLVKVSRRVIHFLSY